MGWGPVWVSIEAFVLWVQSWDEYKMLRSPDWFFCPSGLFRLEYSINLALIVRSTSLIGEGRHTMDNNQANSLTMQANSAPHRAALLPTDQLYTLQANSTPPQANTVPYKPALHPTDQLCVLIGHEPILCLWGKVWSRWWHTLLNMIMPFAADSFGSLDKTLTKIYVIKWESAFFLSAFCWIDGFNLLNWSPASSGSFDIKSLSLLRPLIMMLLLCAAGLRSICKQNPYFCSKNLLLFLVCCQSEGP